MSLDKFWVIINTPLISGVLLIIIKLLFKQLVKKPEPPSPSSPPNPIKETKALKIAAVINKIPTKEIIKIMLVFILSVVFTISAILFTKFDLTNLVPFTNNDFNCGLFRTGIAGNVTEYSSLNSVMTISTTPPTSVVKPDNFGNFKICDIDVKYSSQEFVVTAEGGCYKGSSKISVSANKTSLAMIRLLYSCN